MKSSEILKLAIKKGWYTAYLGVNDTKKNDYYMCIALDKMERMGVITEEKVTKVRDLINIELGEDDVGYCTLNSLLCSWGYIKKIHPCDANPIARKIAISWWQDLIEYLEGIDD